MSGGLVNIKGYILFHKMY